MTRIDDPVAVPIGGLRLALLRVGGGIMVGLVGVIAAIFVGPVGS